MHITLMARLTLACIYICNYAYTCSVLIIVKIQTKTSDSLSTKKRRPKIHVPQSNGKSARMLQIRVL